MQYYLLNSKQHHNYLDHWNCILCEIKINYYICRYWNDFEIQNRAGKFF